VNSKKELYSKLIPKVNALIDKEVNIISNLANISAILKEELQCMWVGFYIVEDEKLVVGPFQGPVACTTIAFGRGVCGKCWETQQSIIVDDVNKYPDHIACSAESNSEIVIPVFDSNKKLQMVLDVDSVNFKAFDEEDKEGLESIATLITALL